MKYLKRKVDEFLLKWKSSPDHKPLLVKGPRQIGKTQSIIHFAESNYSNVIYVDLSSDDYSDIISQGYTVDSVVNRLIYHNLNWKFIPGETIVIFDEIQELPDLMTSLKQFKIDGRYDVICSGSLLGVQYKKISLSPMGYQTNYEMNSMDFEEFLWALGLDNITEELYEHMVSLTPLDQGMYNALWKWFDTYCSLGGMPEAISRYITTNSYEGINALQQSIVALHREDMSKYAEGLDVAKLREVYDSIPYQLAKENKKFQFSKLKKNAKSSEYFGCVKWLEDAGVILRCYSLDTLELPLEGYMNNEVYKIYLADSGLLLSRLDQTSITDFLAKHIYSIYNGGLRENIVAEAFAKCEKKLCYYKRSNSTLEEEFLLRSKEHIVPIEVKTSNGNAKSLKELITNKNYPLIEYGIKLVEGNIGYTNNVYTFPLFCAYLIPKFVSNLD